MWAPQKPFPSSCHSIAEMAALTQHDYPALSHNTDDLSLRILVLSLCKIYWTVNLKYCYKEPFLSSHSIQCRLHQRFIALCLKGLFVTVSLNEPIAQWYCNITFFGQKFPSNALRFLTSADGSRSLADARHFSPLPYRAEGKSGRRRFPRNFSWYRRAVSTPMSSLLFDKPL